MNDPTRYLGDGVYVAPDSGPAFSIVLTTGAHYGCEDGGVDQTIFCESEVVANLYRYLRELHGDT